MRGFGYYYEPTSNYIEVDHVSWQDNSSHAKTEAEMKQSSTYNGWDFSSIWVINGSVLPDLREMPSNIDITDGSVAEPIVNLDNLQLIAQSVPEVALGYSGGGSTSPNDPGGDGDLTVEF